MFFPDPGVIPSGSNYPPTAATSFQLEIIRQSCRTLPNTRSALSTEFTAAKVFLDEQHEHPHDVAQHDNNSYALGRIGSHNVVIAVLPNDEYGIASAAAVARDMLHSFPNVRIGLMVGIGGGAPSSKHDVRLGDVVVSSRDGGKGRVFQYDFGKIVQNQDVSFEHADFLDQPPIAMRTAVNTLKSHYEIEAHQLNKNIERVLEKWPRLRKKYSRPHSDSDRLYQSNILHPIAADGCDSACSDDPTNFVHRLKRDEDDDDPAIHYGLIASSNQLMKNALIRDKLAKEKGVICFEMEAAGLMNHFPCLVIRGVCDYSDSHKNNQWQGFAAMTAAAYATDLLRQIPPNRVEAERRIADVLSSFQEDLERMQRDMSETKAVAITTRDNQHLDKVYRWLSPSDPSSNASRAREHRHAGTGTWLLESAPFNEWKAGERRHLWLYGLAGCGKTVLSTTILDHLQQANGTPTLMFFFDFNDTRKQTLDNLLRSLAFQLYHTKDNASKILDSLLSSHDDGRRQPDANALSVCVELMMQKTQKVSIVIDALDECTTRSELLLWMRRLTSSSNNSNVKLIVTGRPEAEFQHEIHHFFNEDNCILLDKEGVNADIRSYVAYELGQRRDFVDKSIPDNLLEQIQIKVGDGADGMFTWAACQLDTLANCLHAQAIKTALERLPRDLNETYQRMLQNIPPDFKSDGLRLLQFLVYAKRPLALAEAVDIIATQVDDEEQRSFDVDRRPFRHNDVLQYCPSLISIAKVPHDGKVIEEVQLAHFSVKEYLVGKDQFQHPTASVTITWTCLTYLKGVKATGEIKRIKTEFPLARHAAEVWMEHAKEAEIFGNIAQESTKFLLDDSTFQRWGRLYQPDRPWEKNPGPPRGAGLYYASHCGLLRVARGLLANGADVNAQGGGYGNALQAASSRGHQEIVQLLLDKGADANAQGGEHGNALYAASSEGHQEIVQVLLDKEADVHAQGGYYGNALQAASYGGQREVVSLLLSLSKLDLEAKHPHSGRTALSYAAEEGHEAIVEQLITDAHADPDSKDNIRRTPLFFACKEGQNAVVSTLLLRGSIAADWKDYYGSTPLSVAARKGHSDVVRSLLSTGSVVVNLPDNFGRTPLWWTRRHGHAEVSQLLVEAGERGVFSDGDQTAPEVITKYHENPAHYCDICTFSISEDNNYYHYSTCNGNDLDICLDCFHLGGRCLEVSHNLFLRESQ